MSTIIIDGLSADINNPEVPLTELGYRVIKNVRRDYEGGQWNPDNNFNWVPGMFYDYIPLSASSRIRTYCHIPHGRNIGSAHGISHWIFFANGVEQGRHCISGQHIEGQGLYLWDFASWGTSSGRIGYQMRAYSNEANEVRPYTTQYWDGVGSIQFCRGQIIIEEYLPGV